jgi:integrase
MNTKIVILRTKLNAEGKATIYVQYSYLKRTLRISTKEKVAPKDFDSNKQVVKKSYPNYSEINDSINSVKGKIESIIRTARLTDVEPSIDYVYSNYFNTGDKKKETIEVRNKPLLELMEDWITYSKNYKKSDKGTRLKYNTTKNYSTLLFHFTEYFKDKKVTLIPSQIDNKFYDDYTNYLQDEFENYKGIGLDFNSVANDIKILKIFLKWLEGEGIKVHVDYKNFKVNWRATDIIVLEWKEIEKVLSFPLESNNLKLVRDLLIIGCSTGLRISDLLNLTPENIDIERREIKLTTIKTEQKLVVPIIDIAIPIIQKYINKKGKLFDIPAQKFNEELKELGEVTGITNPVTRVSYKLGKRIDYAIPKHKLLTSHICRRTYITELLKRKVPAEIIMQATGHRDYKSFKKYIKLANEDVKIQIQDAFRACLFPDRPECIN